MIETERVTAGVRPGAGAAGRSLRGQSTAGPDHGHRLRAREGGTGPRHRRGGLRAGRVVRRPERVRRSLQARPGPARRPRDARLRAAVARRARPGAGRAPMRAGGPHRPGGAPMRWTGSGRRCWAATCYPPWPNRCRSSTPEPPTGPRCRARPRPWASLVHPDLDPATGTRSSVGRWSATSAGSTNPIRSPPGKPRLATLRESAGKLDELRLDRLQFNGPGTDLTIGLLPSSHWCAAHFTTVDGIEHAPNLPTEEVFTTPDPDRVDGTVTATKPLFTSGTTVTGFKVCVCPRASGLDRGRAGRGCAARGQRA